MDTYRLVSAPVSKLQIWNEDALQYDNCGHIFHILRPVSSYVWKCV